MRANVLEYEPATALFVPDTDPLLFYRRIAELGQELLRPGGKIYFEINEQYAAAVLTLLLDLGYAGGQIRPDMFGKDRMASATGLARLLCAQRSEHTLRAVTLRHTNDLPYTIPFQYMKTMELAIVGLGGVGGYFGFKLAQKYVGTTAASVTFVARGETYAQVKKYGLTLLSPEHSTTIAHPAKLVEMVSELESIDVLLLCVKEYDLEAVCTQLKLNVQDNTVILPLMNGVDIYERIKRIIPTVIVLPACVYVASHIKEKAVVEHKGNPGRIIVGKDPERPEYAPEPGSPLIGRRQHSN